MPFFFFFNDPATPETYTLSLHDALPIFSLQHDFKKDFLGFFEVALAMRQNRTFNSLLPGDRKSTRLNSSHITISYAVFCLKKKNKFAVVLDDAALPAFPLRHPAASAERH